MSRLVRMDQSGHSLLAEWSPADAGASDAAAVMLHDELDQGYIAVLSNGPAGAEQIRELPTDDALVILRRPIAGG